MKKLLLLFSLFFGLNAFAAAPIPIKGQGTATNTAIIGGASRDVKWMARQDAARNAIESELSKGSEALRQQFRQLGDNFNVEDFEKKRILKERLKTVFEEDKRDKTVTAFFSGSLDVSALRDELNTMASTRVATTDGAAPMALSKDKVAVFFTARKYAGADKFDDVVTKTVKAQTNKEAEASQKATDDGVATSETTLRQAKTVLGGGTTEREAKEVYELDGPMREHLAAGLLDRASSKGFNRIVDGATLESSADLDAAYGAGNVVPAKIYKKIANEVKERSAKIKNIVIGTLDFSAPGKDEVTGQVKILASLSGKVFGFDEDGELEIVVSLKPISKYGMAGSKENARKACVDLLSEEAMDEIITKLNNKKKND
jgi:hypothetical protein